MKRFLCVLLIPLMLCGCGGNRKVTPVTSSLKFTADISYYNEYFVCDAVVEESGDMKLSVTAPEDISGLKLNFTDSGITAEYMGITYTPKTDALPIGNVAIIMHDIMRDIDTESPITAKDGKNALYEGRINSRAYKFYFTPSGIPLSIEIPDNSFKIDFKRVEIIR